MSKKILSAAIAAVLVAPLAAQAEVKLSGTIQGELGSLTTYAFDKDAQGAIKLDPNGEPLTIETTQTVSNDGTGALAGGGPNKIAFDFNEDLGGGLKAIGRLDFDFNTSNAKGLGSRESFLGLSSASGAYFRMGRIQGAYKTTTKIDPFYGTSGQMRIGGGESGGTAFTHSSYVDNVFEVGFSGGGFKAALQGIFDEPTGKDGSMLASAEYSNDMFTVFGAFSKDESLDEYNTNWKVGGKFNFAGLGIGLQYESSEMNSSALGLAGMSKQATPYLNAVSTAVVQALGVPANISVKYAGTDYITGSLTYGMGNVILGGWVSQSTGNFDVTATSTATPTVFVTESTDDFDAMSFALGGIYTFSKKTLVYGAYHSIDVDGTDIGDLDGFAAGIRHSF